MDDDRGRGASAGRSPFSPRARLPTPIKGAIGAWQNRASSAENARKRRKNKFGHVGNLLYTPLLAFCQEENLPIGTFAHLFAKRPQT